MKMATIQKVIDLNYGINTLKEKLGKLGDVEKLRGESAFCTPDGRIRISLGLTETSDLIKWLEKRWEDGIAARMKELEEM